jgi:hypothetical protein
LAVVVAVALALAQELLVFASIPLAFYRLLTFFYPLE